MQNVCALVECRVSLFSPFQDQDDGLWLVTGKRFESYKLWCLTETKVLGGGWGEDGGDYSSWSVEKVESRYGVPSLRWLPLDPAGRGGEAVTILAFRTFYAPLLVFALSCGRRSEGGTAAAAAGAAGEAGPRARNVLEKKINFSWAYGDILCLTPEGVLVRRKESKVFEFHPYNL